MGSHPEIVDEQHEGTRYTGDDVEQGLVRIWLRFRSYWKLWPYAY